MEASEISALFDSTGPLYKRATLQELDLESDQEVINRATNLAKRFVRANIFREGKDYYARQEGECFLSPGAYLYESIPFLQALGVDLDKFFIANSDRSIDLDLSLIGQELSPNLKLLGELIIGQVIYNTLDELENENEPQLVNVLTERALNRADLEKLNSIIVLNEDEPEHMDLLLDFSQFALGVKVLEIAEKRSA